MCSGGGGGRRVCVCEARAWRSLNGGVCVWVQRGKEAADGPDGQRGECLGSEKEPWEEEQR